MRRFGLLAVIVVTALISCAVTSAFWLIAFNRGPVPAGSPIAAPPPPVATPKADLELGPTGLAIPVAGIKASQLADTYSQSRAGGARVHNAIDIMAPAGTPVVAAAPGTVEKLFFSDGGGGITAYVRSADKAWTFYYAHLQAYAPGLHEGQAVKQGDAIGLVGSTGNANPAGPHLHFAINRMAAGEDWHEGTPINPYPLLAGNGPRR
ncbi:M23 family metallopeptidase [Sphingosinicella sp. BN140058]|uniref:M23 family metallopeptidase n=1 Tax=Sphingosinicella sp. BN140058 TaxID=1892855 RepID=UPI001012A7D1|nr:M23 family metallopeptidase [Sphingosinicella sp. BN140058]QAY78997.1 M23 family metallopeptidase [Sphingosinicella sp. BN140058]